MERYRMFIAEIPKGDGDYTIRGGESPEAEYAVRSLDAIRALVYALKIGSGSLCDHGFSRDGSDYIWERFGVRMRVEEFETKWWATIMPSRQPAREAYTRPSALLGEVRA